MNTTSFSVDFIGVGAAKAGTTWITQCLSEHPDIFIPEKKELNFFNRKYGVVCGEKGPFLYAEGLQVYEKLFSKRKNEKIQGEFSINYLHDPEALALIKKHFPETKIIVALRNPVTRTYSHVIMEQSGAHPWLSKSKRERWFATADFLEVIQKEPEFIHRSQYKWQLEELFKHFPRKQIQILLTDDIKNDPVAFMADLYRFLDVDDTFIAPSALIRVGEATKARSQLLNKLIFWLFRVIFFFWTEERLLRFIDQCRETVLGLLISRFERWSRVSVVEKPTLSPEAVKYIVTQTKEDVAYLKKLLGRELWKEHYHTAL